MAYSARKKSEKQCKAAASVGNGGIWHGGWRKREKWHQLHRKAGGVMRKWRNRNVDRFNVA